MSPSSAQFVDPELFMGLRSQLFGIAYRMLSCTSEAEDVVQDVWFRWQGCDRDTVRDPAAFLVTTTTRLCINVLQSAHTRRETYLGPWLPEPVDTDADPALGAERTEALQFATLVVLEKLPPAERAAFILRQAFDYPYPMIGHIIGVSEVNARQLVHRARKHLASGARSTPARPAEHQQLLSAFVAAARRGDTGVLEKLLAAQAAA